MTKQPSKRTGKETPPQPFKKKLIASAIASCTALGGSAVVSAQTGGGSSDDDVMEEVIVTGIRGSLQRSMDIKRDAQGVVDAISAEDIGKMPDTNLAEALQRITGVSIDRTNGEGSLVTVRGFGPTYNVVTLNGRYMPVASVEDTAAASSRNFDFAQLAAEAVSGVEVYKTGRADLPTGGIGSTLNVRTTRPLEVAERILSFGGKILNDTTNEGGGDDYTPEVSGIYAESFADDTFGVALSASYSERDSGAAAGNTPNGWYTINGGQGDWGSIAADNENFENPPQPGDIYAVPRNINYSFSQVQRERTNAQLTLQYRPIDTLTATLDYTYSSFDTEHQENAVGGWFNGNPVSGSFTRGSGVRGSAACQAAMTTDDAEDDQAACRGIVVALNEYEDSTGADTTFSTSSFGRENELNSTGFNLEWDATEDLTLAFDYHNSESEIGAKDNRGTHNTLTGVQFNRGGQTVDYTGDLPILAIDYTEPLDPADMLTSGSSFRNSYMKHEIEQARFSGEWRFDDRPYGVRSVDFGLSHTDSRNRSAYANHDRQTWGGYGAVDPTTLMIPEDPMSPEGGMISYPDPIPEPACRTDEVLDVCTEAQNDEFKSQTAERDALVGRFQAAALELWKGDYPDEIFTEHQLSAEFKEFDTSGIMPVYYRADFNGMVNAISAIAAETDGTVGPCGTRLCAPSEFTTDRTIEEEQLAIYAQVNFAWEDVASPMHLTVGLRYEETDVDSRAFVPEYSSLEWSADNEFTPIVSGGSFTSSQGSYTNWLPNIDFDIEVAEDVVLRASYSETITRPSFADLQNGKTIASPVRITGGTGSFGDPDLDPFESTNFDLSAEWYYAEGSYVSLGYYRKDVKNFIGTSIVPEELFNLAHPGQGTRYNAALEFVRQAYADANDLDLMDPEDRRTVEEKDLTSRVRRRMEQQNNGEPVVGDAAQGDPATVFDLSFPVNAEEAEIDGWEFAVQHMFSDTGFGLIFNYTIVDGDVAYDNASRDTQFALLGLSDSYNLIAFYDKDGLEARMAYNWRDDFLNSTVDGSGENPIYTEEYSQLDLSISYELPQVEGLTIIAEGINVTDETRRTHGRHPNMVLSAIEQGARYSLGLRYQF